MKKVKIYLITAARPNIMKIAPLYHALKKEKWCRPLLVHTGQHYDVEMCSQIYRDLSLPEPDFSLGVGSGTHAEQTAGVMIKYEELCLRRRPDLTVVAGDVNSTLACAITSKKLFIPVAHLEAGLRSGDMTMPEEINRIVTDSISDILWTPSADADENLIRAGISREKIQRVGNIMIDSYEMLKPEIESPQAYKGSGVEKTGYALITIHRPSNVDSRKNLESIVSAIRDIAEKIPVLFPVHPRTRKKLLEFNLLGKLSSPRIHLGKPLGYLKFMSLVRKARLVVTDSGGIQEETTYLHLPCLTLRSTTERPITITQGSNKLVRTEDLMPAVNDILKGKGKRGICPAYWDGHTAGRIVKSLRNRFKGRRDG